MERDGPLELDKACIPENGEQRETEKGKKRKTYFTYWSAHDLENWELQSQPTITSDELEELEELKQLIATEKEELDKKNNKICSNCNLQYAGEIWICECLCVYECFCSYECLCAIAQREFANM